MRKPRYTGWGLGERRAYPPSVLIFDFDVCSAHLAQNYGSNVGEEFHREFDRRLLKKVKKTWPLSG